MNRGAQPLAIVTHRQYRPHSEIRRPLRPAMRQQMFGPIQPADPPQSRICNLIVIALFAVVAVLSMVKGFNW
jgi:hypothetical protein